MQATVERFLTAYSNGSITAEDSLLAPPSTFVTFADYLHRWGDGKDAADRSTIPDYLGARAAVHDQIRLTKFEFFGYQSADDAAGFWFEGERHDDSTPAFHMGGLGSLDCGTGTINKLVLGDPSPAA